MPPFFFVHYYISISFNFAGLVTNAFFFVEKVILLSPNATGTKKKVSLYSVGTSQTKQFNLFCFYPLFFEWNSENQCWQTSNKSHYYGKNNDADYSEKPWEKPFTPILYKSDCRNKTNNPECDYPKHFIFLLLFN